MFREEALWLWEQRNEHWPKMLDVDGHQHELRPLDLDDVVFQLCERDKAQRKKTGGGPVRLYGNKPIHPNSAEALALGRKTRASGDTALPEGPRSDGSDSGLIWYKGYSAV